MNKYNVGDKVFVYCTTKVLTEPCIAEITITSIKEFNGMVIYNSFYDEKYCYTSLTDLQNQAIIDVGNLVRKYLSDLDKEIDDILLKRKEENKK